MLKFLVGLPRHLLTGAAIALTALFALFTYGRAKKQEGASTVILEALQEDSKKLEKAREAAYEEKRDVNGVSDSDLIDRLRRRSDNWSGM